MRELVDVMLDTGPSETAADDIIIKRLIMQLRGMVGIRAKMTFTDI